MPVTSFSVVHSAVQDLSPRLRSAFAALCSRRLAVLLAASPAADRPFVSELWTLHDDLWRHLTVTPLKEVERSAAVDRAMALVDAAGDSDYLAEDAAASLAFAFRSLDGGDPQDAVWAAERAFNYHDSLAQRAMPSNSSDADLLEYPLVQGELGRQIEDLADLRLLSTVEDTGPQLELLRRRTDALRRDA